MISGITDLKYELKSNTNMSLRVWLQAISFLRTYVESDKFACHLLIQQLLMSNCRISLTIITRSIF